MAPNCEKKKTKQNKQNKKRQSLKFLQKIAFMRNLIVSQMSFVPNLFLGVHALKCDVDIISSNFNEQILRNCPLSLDCSESQQIKYSHIAP